MITAEVTIMLKPLKWIKQHLIIAIAISIALAVFIGSVADVSWLRRLILPLTFVLVYPMMVTLRLDTLRGRSNWRLQVLTQLINFVVFPLIAWAIGLWFFGDEPYFRLGLLLIALLPTSGMTISWTVMAKGNVNEAIRMIVIGLLLGAVLSPLYITLLLGEAIAVPAMTIATQILIVIFLPLLMAYLTQRILKHKYGETTFHQTIKPVFPLFSTLGVVMIIFVAIALKADVIVANPGMILTILGPLILMYLTFLAITITTARLLFGREDGIALVNGTMIRNLSIALAITLSAFEGAGIAALLIAVAYAIQVQIAAWNVRASKWLFPPKNDLVAD